MSNPEDALKAKGLTLPPAPAPVAAYIPWRRSGDLLYVAGQIPMRAGTLVAKGAVPGQVSVEQALECAVQCTLNGLAVAKAALGDIDKIRQVVRVGVFVCSEPGFYDQPKVANACSELLVSVLGERGKHARAAVGSVALPLGAPVEIEFLFEVE
jgi:enamine deaminase RidA (YjgF/YER057c/UK114 family)